MSEVILRYWKNGIKLPDATYGHFSLETSQYYFSAHPDTQVGEVKQAENGQVHPIKFVDKDPDLKALGNPDAEIRLDLNEAKIHAVLSTLNSATLNWVPYGKDQDGVNSVILVLLALKRSGYYETIDRSTFQYNQPKESVTDFFYRYVVKQDRISEYKPILKILNRDVQPDDVLVVANMNVNPPAGDKLNGFLKAGIMITAGAAISFAARFLLFSQPAVFPQSDPPQNVQGNPISSEQQNIPATNMMSSVAPTANISVDSYRANLFENFCP